LRVRSPTSYASKPYGSTLSMVCLEATATRTYAMSSTTAVGTTTLCHPKASGVPTRGASTPPTTCGSTLALIASSKSVSHASPTTPTLWEAPCACSSPDHLCLSHKTYRRPSSPTTSGHQCSSWRRHRRRQSCFPNGEALTVDILVDGKWTQHVVGRPFRVRRLVRCFTEKLQSTTFTSD
jgi:hypothetical protein